MLAGGSALSMTLTFMFLKGVAIWTFPPPEVKSSKERIGCYYGRISVGHARLYQRLPTIGANSSKGCKYHEVHAICRLTTLSSEEFHEHCRI